MMQKGIIPPQAIFHDLKPQIPPLDEDGIAIRTQPVSRRAGFKVACVNKFGASGTNAAMIMMQP